MFLIYKEKIKKNIFYIKIILGNHANHADVQAIAAQAQVVAAEVDVLHNQMLNMELQSTNQVIFQKKNDKNYNIFNIIESIRANQ